MTHAMAAQHRSVSSMHPWDPVSAVESRLPDRVTPDWVAELLTRSPDALTTVLRAHLVPAKKKDGRYTAQFRALWRSIAFLDRRMRSRLLAILQNWLDDAGAALDRDDLDAHERRTIEFFVRDVEGAVNRVHREINEPMSWAGNEFANYPLAVRGVIETLVIGIDELDQGGLTQAQLVGLLAALGLDPGAIADHRDTEIPEQSRQRVIDAAKQGRRPDFKR